MANLSQYSTKFETNLYFFQNGQNNSNPGATIKQTKINENGKVYWGHP